MPKIKEDNTLRPKHLDINRKDLKQLMDKRKKRQAKESKAKGGLERDADRNDDKMDIGFYLCLVFQSFEQKWEFLNALKDVPTLYGSYVDGQTLAKKLGIKVKPNTQKPFHTHVQDKLKDLTLESTRMLKKKS